MPLIIKGQKEPTIISKKDMENKIGSINDEKNKDEFSDLPPEVAEKRREILEAKRHREFMGRVQAAEEAAMARLKSANVEVTEEIVIEQNTVNVVHDDIVTVSSTDEVLDTNPAFEKMTKAEIANWAEENIGLTLDRRKKKAELIETVKNNL